MVKPRQSLGPTDANALQTSIATIFQETQKSLSTQRKNVIQLRKLQERALEYGLENVFIEGFLKCLNKTLPVKKGAAVADRVIKFVGAFVQFIVDKDMSLEVDSEDEESVSSRFVDVLLRHLLKGVSAKDKHVRMRIVQLISESISALQNIDVDLYNDLKAKLFERLKEKDATVRGQAVKAIAGLQLNDELEDENGKSVDVVMMEMLELDPSLEVRKAVVETLEATSSTIQTLVLRARDTDPTIRKSFYTKTMEQESMQLHNLSLEDREKIVKLGIHDRDPNVKKAAVKMICDEWIKEKCDGNIVEFLGYFDVFDNWKLCNDLVFTFFEYFPKWKPVITDDIWYNLTPEVVFVIRAYCEMLWDKKDDGIEDFLPEVSHHVVLLQHYYNLSCEMEEDEEKKIGYDFILGELLKLAKFLDYADEVGRRKMFNYLRELVGSFSVDEDHVPDLINVMKSISVNERDFGRVLIEIMFDLLSEVDGINKTPKKIEQEEIRYTKMFCMMRCLQILKCVMEKLDKENFEDFGGLLNDLVLKAIKIQEEEFMAVKILGYHCLGLYCCLNRELSKDYLRVFLYGFQSGVKELEELCLKVVFDLIVLYGFNAWDDDLIKVLKKGLEHEDDGVLTIAVEGVSKLFILRYTQDEELLTALMVLYFHPLTQDNVRLRQCLSVFFEAFSHSSIVNKKLVSKVVPQVMISLNRLGTLNGMQGMFMIGQYLLDLTDVRRLVKPEDEIDSNLHQEIFVSLFKNLFIGKQNGKIVAQLMNKAYFVKNDGLKEFIGFIEDVKGEVDSISWNLFKRVLSQLYELQGNTIVENIRRKRQIQVNYQEEGEVEDEKDEEYQQDLE